MTSNVHHHACDHAALSSTQDCPACGYSRDRGIGFLVDFEGAVLFLGALAFVAVLSYYMAPLPAIPEADIARQDDLRVTSAAWTRRIDLGRPDATTQEWEITQTCFSNGFDTTPYWDPCAPDDASLREMRRMETYVLNAEGSAGHVALDVPLSVFETVAAGDDITVQYDARGKATEIQVNAEK